MKILLDHNLDRNLKGHLEGHTVETARERGWTDLINGALLDAAETNGFDVLITADSNLKKQQNFSHRSLSILVLRAYNNRLATHLTMIDEVKATLSKIRPGEIIELFHSDFTLDPRRREQ